MRMHRFVILAVLIAALAVAATGVPAVTGKADLQKAVAAKGVGADHRNGSWETGALARADRANRTIPAAATPPWGGGEGIGPNKTVPVGPAIAVPTAAPRASPTLPGVRLGQRRSLVGGSLLTPPIGNTTVPGRALGLARNRTALGAGTAAGPTRPGRFVRWSPAGRWRSGAT